jgi:hypothetical protein
MTVNPNINNQNAMLCFGVECKKDQVVYVILHDLVDLKIRST